MSSGKCILTIVATLFVFHGSAVAQAPPPTTATSLVACAYAGGLNVYNSIDFLNSTTYYEVARQPGTPNACIQVNFRFDTNKTTMNVSTTYSNNPQAIWQNQTTSVNVSVVQGNGVTFPYQPTLQNGSVSGYIYKFLNISQSNIILCGYDSKNGSDAFGLILTTTRQVSEQDIQNIANSVSASNENFQNLAKVNQSTLCIGQNSGGGNGGNGNGGNGNGGNGNDHGNTATTIAPALTAIFALFYTVLKVIN